MRGYFEIGVVSPKNSVNIGTLWRTAYQLGAASIFTIGKRCRLQSADTTKTPRHIPFREYESWEQLKMTRPWQALLVAVEEEGKPLSEFNHPERAVYILGAEDSGLPLDVIAECNHHVSLESVRTSSYNVAMAGGLVMYHRLISRLRGKP